MKKTLLFLVFLSCFLNSANAQFSQNFDSSPSIPSGWSVINGGDTNTWTVGTPGGGTAFSGSNVAKILYNSSVAHNDYLVTPQISVVTGVNDRLTFRVRSRDATFLEHFDVKVSTTTAAPAASFSTTLLPDTVAGFDWTKITLDLTPYAGQSIFIGFHAVSLDKWELYLDDIINDTAPVCNYAAPTIASTVQPTCTATGSVTLSGLPSTGTWTLYTTYSSGASNISSTTTGSGSTTSVSISNESFNDRIYSFHFIDTNGCQSPESNQVFVNEKYYFSPSFLGEYQDTNNDGISNIGDQVVYHIVLNNFGSCAIGNSDISVMSGPAYSSSVSLGTFNFPANFTQNQDYFYDITQGDINNGYVDCGLQINPLFGSVGYDFSNQIVVDITPLNTNGIRLTAFIDSNFNGIKEASEPLFPFGDFQFSKNNMPPTVVSSSNGMYFIPEWNAANSYNLSFTVNPIFSNYLSASANFTAITAAAGTGITDYYFPVTSINTTGDLQVNVIPLGNAPRPGAEYKNRIAYINNFSFPVSGTLTFTKDDAVSITSVSQSGTVDNGNGFSSTFFLQPHEARYMDVVMQVNPSAIMGNLVTNTATITIPANDVYPQNNSSSLTQAIVNSFDPNNKTETHGGKIVLANFSNTDYLTYTINFENIGTANANMVKIEDYLDFRLDANSLIMISSSHNCILEKWGSSLTWKFDKINLVPNGKGFVTFNIKPRAGYSIGTIIPNTANIVFDFNTPITTNTANTEFVSFLNTDESDFSGFHYFPNPVKNSLFISNTSAINRVAITSVLGQTVMTKNIDGLQSEIDLSQLQSGIYFVTAMVEGREKTFRIIKQ